MSIADNCMTANLSLGMWEGRRLDRGASNQLATDSAAGSDTVRVNKLIVSKECLSPVGTARNALRSHFLDRTLPWRDNGDRLLVRGIYQVFIQEHEALVEKFNGEISELINVRYPAEKARAEFRMGKLYNPDDYPDAEELRAKFYARLEIDAVNEAGDFRVQLDEDAIERVREQMTAAMEERINRAMTDVWTRVSDTIEHLAGKLSDKEGVFKSSTIDNLDRLIDALPAMNITGDPNLKRIAKEMKAKLHGQDAKKLRQDRKVRAAVAADAAEIMDQVRGFFNAIS